MPYIRIYPESTVSNDIPSSGLGGKASSLAHTLVNDNSLLTYIRQVHSGIGTQSIFNMGSFTLQDNERIVGVRIGMIRAHTHPMGVVASVNSHGSMSNGTWKRVPWFDVTKPKLAPVFYSEWFYKNKVTGLEWDQTSLDAMTLRLAYANPGGTFDARAYEVWVDVWVRADAVPAAVWPNIGSVVQTDIPRMRWQLPFEDGIPYAQDQYELKVFTKAVVEGGGFDPSTSAYVAWVPPWVTSMHVAAPWHPHPLLKNNARLIWGDEYYWSVRSRTKMPGGNAPQWSEWMDPTPFKVTTKPAIGAMTPTGVVTTNLPKLTWENDDAEGDIQQAWEVRLVQEPGGGWGTPDPLQYPVWQKWAGKDRTSREVQVSRPLADNSGWRAYFRIAQQTFETLTWDSRLANSVKETFVPGPLLWGDWEYSEFDTDYVEPDAPELDIQHFEDHVELTVTPGTEPLPADIDYYVIERSLDNGETWAPFPYGVGDETTSEMDDLTSPFVVQDHEIPLFTEVMYRAYSVSTDLGPGFELASAYSNVVTSYLQSSDIWLKDTGDYNNNDHFPYQDEWINRTTNRVRGIYTPLGRSNQVVVRGQNQSDSFSVTFVIIGAEKKQKMENIIRSNRTVYLTSPKGCWYLDISGPVSWRDRMGDRRQGEEDIYTVTIPFVEVDRDV